MVQHDVYSALFMNTESIIIILITQQQFIFSVFFIRVEESFVTH